MIPITKEEKMLLQSLYPKYKFPRTMKKDSKRHHYYCTELVNLMRPIVNTNIYARRFMEEYEREQKLRAKRSRYGGRAR